MATTITATKNRRTLLAPGTSVAAGGSVSAIWGDGTIGVAGCALPTSPDVCTLIGKVTNGSTGPTVGATLLVETSGDGSTNWEQVASLNFPITASTSFPFAIDLPKGTRFCRATVSGNTGQAVTVDLFGDEFTSYTTSP